MNDEEEQLESQLARTVDSRDLANPDGGSRTLALLRASSALEADAMRGALATEALLSVLDTNAVVFVRDDDGKLWPFVKGDEYWRGVLRLTEDQRVEEARFFPAEERIDWVNPWTT